MPNRSPNVRTRLKHFDPSALTGPELLSIIYGTTRDKRGSLELAERVFKNYGNRAITHEHNALQLQKITGLPLEECYRTIAVFELGRRYICPRGRPRTIHKPEDAYLLLRGQMEGLSKECLYGIYLDSDHRILRESVISIGTLDETFMNPRDIFLPAMECNAAKVVIAHNHPSGNPEPSAQDIENTKKAQEAGRMLGFPLLDHIVIGYGKFKSILQEDPLGIT
jgi:DNA repair protein RadC